MVKVIGICEGYVEDKWVIRSVLLFLSVNINPSSMYLQKIKRPVVSLFEKNVSSLSSKAKSAIADYGSCLSQLLWSVDKCPVQKEKSFGH